MIKGPRILFMGTPEFAVASLDAIKKKGYNIVGVVTAPDKPAGRGRLIMQSAVAKYASENSLNLLQPGNLKDESFISQLTELEPDIAVVVAFRMLPERVWSVPTSGTFNLHASLLPQYRGAAPINHAIINGETSTGVTTFLIDKKIDTGNILLREEVNIGPDENAGELHDRLMYCGADLVVRTVKMLTKGQVKAIDQNQFITGDEELKPAPKIFSKDCYIDWSEDINTIHNFVRGLSPYPGARTMINVGGKDTLVKILEARPCYKKSETLPGQASTEIDDKLRISCKNGYIELIKIQAEGKKAMNVADYLRGIDPSSIDILTNPQV